MKIAGVALLILFYDAPLVAFGDSSLSGFVPALPCVKVALYLLGLFLIVKGIFGQIGKASRPGTDFESSAT